MSLRCDLISHPPSYGGTYETIIDNYFKKGTMTNSSINIEWAPFTLAEGTDENTLLEASEALQTDFLIKQNGFIRRELLKGKDNQWVDLVHWETSEAAAQAMKNAENSPACHKYFQCMVVNDQDPGAGVLHFEQMKTY